MYRRWATPILLAAASGTAQASRPQLPSPDTDHIAQIRFELAQLVKIYAPVAGKQKVSAAELISRTSFASRDRTSTCACCQGDVAVSEICRAKDVALTCTNCLQQRLHFLASEDFCYATWNSTSTGRVEPAGESAVLKQIIRSFKSVEHFEDELRTFAMNKGVPGWTWVVWNPKWKPPTQCEPDIEGVAKRTTAGRIEIVNFPGNMTPITVGLWPLACIDVTDRAVTREFARVAESTTLSEPSLAPPWSRAARNPQAAVTREVDPRAQGYVTLDSLRRAIVSRSIAALNYSFLDIQLGSALKHYATDVHDAKVAAHLQQVGHKVKSDFIATLPQVTIVDDSGQGGDTSAPGEPAAAQLASSQPEGLDDIQLPPATPATPATQAAAEAASPALAVGSESDDQASSGAEVAVPAPSAVQEDRQYEHMVREDGTEVFTYANGDFTEKYANKTVFHQQGGASVREVYDSGKEVWIVDGVVTTIENGYTSWRYPDGRLTTQDAEGNVLNYDANGNAV